MLPCTLAVATVVVDKNRELFSGRHAVLSSDFDVVIYTTEACIPRYIYGI